MKNLLFLFLIFSSHLAIAQSYLGITTLQGNLRESPALNGNVLDILKQNTQVFIYNVETTNDFYKVIDINSDQEGWLHKNLVKLVKPLSRSKNGLFTSEGKREGSDCSVSVTNNTSLKVTLRLNETYYYFDAQETKRINIPAGNYEYIASAPSVIPYYGDDTLEGGNSYSWTFFVQTSYGYGGGSGRGVSKRRRR